MANSLHQPSPHSTWGARLVWISTLALAALCLALTRLNGLSPARYFTEYILSGLLGALAFAGVGGLIVARQPANRTGRLMCAAGIGFALAVLLQQYARYSMVTRPGGLPGGELATWLNAWTWFPLIGLVAFFLPLTFPDGRLPSARWRWAAWLAAAAIAAQTISLALSPGPVDASLAEVSNPFADEFAAAWPWMEGLLRVLNPLAIGLLLLSLAAAVAAPIARALRAQDVEHSLQGQQRSQQVQQRSQQVQQRSQQVQQRAQLKWFALAAAILAATLAVPILAYYPNFTDDTLLSGILLSVGFPVLPAAVGIAVLRYRLYDIDIIIRRTLVYSTLTLLLALVYFVSVLLIQALLRSLTGATSSLAIVASTLAIAALFNPLRGRVQRFIDRRFYRGQYDSERVLAAFSTAMKQEVDLPRLTGMLLEVVDASLHADKISIWLVGERPKGQ